MLVNLSQRLGGGITKTEYMIDEEVELILRLLMPENRLAIRIALHTGLRIGDVLRLKADQVKPNFWVTEQKTGKRRQVGLPASLLEDCKKNARGGWVFPGRSGEGPRTRQAVWKDMKRAAKAMRLPQNVAPHSARKVYAVELRQRYGDIERVKRALNHDNDVVTMIYAMADYQLAAKMRKRKTGRRSC